MVLLPPLMLKLEESLVTVRSTFVDSFCTTSAVSLREAACTSRMHLVLALHTTFLSFPLLVLLPRRPFEPLSLPESPESLLEHLLTLAERLLEHVGDD